MTEALPTGLQRTIWRFLNFKPRVLGRSPSEDRVGLFVGASVPRCLFFSKQQHGGSFQVRVCVAVFLRWCLRAGLLCCDQRSEWARKRRVFLSRCQLRALEKERIAELFFTPFVLSFVFCSQIAILCPHIQIVIRDFIRKLWNGNRCFVCFVVSQLRLNDRSIFWTSSCILSPGMMFPTDKQKPFLRFPLDCEFYFNVDFLR